MLIKLGVFMKNSKLLTLLNHLTTNELKRLDLYLQSPFFIEEKKRELHKRACSLFFYVLERRGETKDLTKEELFAYIYSKETFKAIKINQLMAYLVKKIEQFIIHIRENKDDYVNNIRQKQVLLDFYIEKNLNKWYDAQKRDIEKLQRQVTIRNSDFYFYQFLVECSYAKLISRQTNRKEKASSKELVNSLKYYYILSLLDVACIVKRGFTFDSDDFKLIKDNLEQVKNVNDKVIPSIEIYQYALELIEGEERDNTYVIFKKVFMEYHTCFFQNEARNLFMYGLNYCIKHLNKSREEYYEECWELYRLGIENKILYVDKKIMPPDLKNIITLSLRLKKYDWAEEFLNQHKNKIQAANPKEIYSFNLANVFFYQQKYSKVHQILASLKCKDIFYDLAMRRLEIKVFYEQEEIELLYSKINAYRVFIHRTKNIDKNSKEMNNNFLNLLGKLIKTIPRDKKQLEILEKELQKTSKLAERKWIIAKLEELK